MANFLVDKEKVADMFGNDSADSIKLRLAYIKGFQTVGDLLNASVYNIRKCNLADENRICINLSSQFSLTFRKKGEAPLSQCSEIVLEYINEHCAKIVSGAQCA